MVESTLPDFAHDNHVAVKCFHQQPNFHVDQVAIRGNPVGRQGPRDCQCASDTTSPRLLSGPLGVIAGSSDYRVLVDYEVRSLSVINLDHALFDGKVKKEQV